MPPKIVRRNQGDIYNLADIFRAQLLQNERQASNRMLNEYGKAWKTIDTNIRDLVSKYETDGKRNTGWIYQADRLKILNRQVERELLQFAKFADKTIQDQQREALEIAQKHSEELIKKGLGPLPPGVDADKVLAMVAFQKLPTTAFESMVGFLQDGSPLMELLKKIPVDGGKTVEEGLKNGLLMGWGAEKTARNIRKGLAGDMMRAMRISRTEVARAYREATYRSFNNNSHLLTGWIWRSARNVRTCGMCWAMDGTVHAVTERLTDHVCGRCFAVPLTKTWDQLGFDIPRTMEIERKGIVDGQKAFKGLPEHEKLMILGNAKYNAYKAGAIQLPDLIGVKFSQKWGETHYEKSLKEILGDNAKGYYKKPPKPKQPPSPSPTSTPTLPTPPKISPSSAIAPVSNAFKDIPGGKLNKPTKKALDLIDKVHGDGSLPEIPLKSFTSRRTGTMGQYRYYPTTGESSGIKINTVSPHPLGSIIHEIGHFLDHRGIGFDKLHWGTDGNELDGVFDAIRNSAAYKKLQDMRKGGTVTLSYQSRITGETTSVDVPVDRSYVNYLLNAKELWARSYFQYIAAKTNDPSAIDALETRLNDYPMQWQDDDFKPILKEIDKLFASKGWLK